MLIYRQTQVKRDVDAIEIPNGAPTKLSAGTQVIVLQQVGGAYTVMTPDGFSFRVAGKDGDAIGEPAIETPPPATLAPGREVDENAVLDVLRTVYDPEIPVNIVELGLVYECKIEPRPEGGKRARIRMTLTAPGCGMGQVLKTEVEQKVRALPGIEEVDCALVWDPPWDRTRMSEAAKLELGFF